MNLALVNWFRENESLQTLYRKRQDVATRLGIAPHRLLWALSLICLNAAVASCRSTRTPHTAAPTPTPRAAYLQRGDEVDQRYQIHRQNLEGFFNRFGAVLEKEEPGGAQKLLPPAPVPFGYQILPTLLENPPPSKQRSRIILSPFSWSRTDTLIDRDRESLAALEARLAKSAKMGNVDRLREHAAMAAEYGRLVKGQKLIASTIQYNRLWQSEIARLPEAYKAARDLQNAALERQSLLDSMSLRGEQPGPEIKARTDSLSRRLDSALRKSPTPDYVRVSHPAEHNWIFSVPLYTDIADSSFVEQARATIENGWQLHDGTDDFRLKLDIRRLSSSALYPNGTVPAKGAHIDMARHVGLFPPDGAVLTTGGNTTYVLGRSIIIGPQAIARRILVHEFGHILGFRDGYFRSYRDQGADGYQVLEVILDPDEIIVTPENGKARREHFYQLVLGAR